MTARAGQLERPDRGSRFSGWWPLPFVLLAIVCALYAATATVRAADTWTALACGRHIVAHGVNDTDPFSFNSRPPAAAALSPKASWWGRASARWHPTGWINQNWRTHVVLYEAVSHLGYDSLFAVRVLIYFAVAALIWRTMRVQQVSPAGASLAIIAVIVTLRGCLEVR